MHFEMWFIYVCSLLLKTKFWKIRCKVRSLLFCFCFMQFVFKTSSESQRADKVPFRAFWDWKDEIFRLFSSCFHPRASRSLHSPRVVGFHFPWCWGWPSVRKSQSITFLMVISSTGSPFLIFSAGDNRTPAFSAGYFFRASDLRQIFSSSNISTKYWLAFNPFSPSGLMMERIFRLVSYSQVKKVDLRDSRNFGLSVE